jgi:hypothetical protein
MPGGAGGGDAGVEPIASVTLLESVMEEVAVSAPDAAAVADGSPAETMSPPLAFEAALWNHAAANGTLATASAVFQFKKELAFINPNRFPPLTRPPLMSPGWCYSLPSKWPADT